MDYPSAYMFLQHNIGFGKPPQAPQQQQCSYWVTGVRMSSMFGGFIAVTLIPKSKVKETVHYIDNVHFLPVFCS